MTSLSSLLLPYMTLEQGELGVPAENIFERTAA